MAKKASAGAPGWMVTFADLMALLLTLFVLLLTFAEMDILKFKQIAGSLRNAFGIAQSDELAGVIELEGTKRRTAATDTSLARRPDEIPEVTEEQEFETDAMAAQKAAEEREQRADALQEALEGAIAEEIAGSGIQVERKEGAVVVRFPSEKAFPSGSGELTPAFAVMLDKLAPVLQTTPGQIYVAGHTDNVPIAGGFFRSNWDLSAARATSVVHHLIDPGGLDPSRITVQGYGESRPIAPNDTAENRAKNRRVEISVVTR